MAPGATKSRPAPSLKIVSTSLVALKEASTVEAVVLVKLEVVTAVPCKAKVLAVTVPPIAGRDAIVTLFDMLAVTEPIWAVPATRAGSVAMVRLLPIVTVPDMGIGLPEETAAPDPVPMYILAGTGFVA